MTGFVLDLSVGEIAPAGFRAAIEEAARFLTRPAASTGARSESFALAPGGAVTSGALVHPMQALELAPRHART